MDRIRLQQLRISCFIGARQEERRAPQEVLVTLILGGDFRRAGTSDRLEDTVDYGELSRRVIALVEGSSFFLIERLAEQVAALCLGEPLVQQVEVWVEKPHALPNGGTARIEIFRARPA
jgi:FolB domain-containing protein